MDGKDDSRIDELTRLRRIIVGAVTVGSSSLLLIIFISITTQLSVQRIHSALEEDLRFCKDGNGKIDGYVHTAYQLMGVERREKRDITPTGYSSTNTTVVSTGYTTDNGTTVTSNGYSTTTAAPVKDSKEAVIALVKDVKITVSPVTVAAPCSCGIGPAGDAGPDGEAGADGEDGASGNDGVAGPDYEGSYKGVNEEWCFTCPKAPAGQRGRPGSHGIRGRPGNDGAPGRDGVPGKRGERGDQGRAGAPGWEGRAGDRGANGIVVKVNGPFGRPGVTGRPGENGERGQNGFDGKEGRKGRDGEEGEAGLRGRPGNDGQDGTRGYNGRQGAEGSCAHCVRRSGVRKPVQSYHQSGYTSYSTSGSSSYSSSSSPSYTTVNPPAAEPPVPHRYG